MAFTTASLRGLRTPGRHHDGDGLWLEITASRCRSWVYRFMLHGRARYMGLGSLDHVGLAEARELRNAAAKLRRQGIDPIDHRACERERSQAESSDNCFAAVVERCLTAHAPAWTPSTLRHWRGSLLTYAVPQLGKLPIATIDTQHVLAVLQPLWLEHTETAVKLRGRMEKVLSFAITHGWRPGPNPAVWRGHLQNLLPPPSKIHETIHFPGLPWPEAPAFMAQLKQKTEYLGTLALRFLIQTGVRSNEARGAVWNEVNLADSSWDIPKARMPKNREPHRVPLTPAALAILHEAAPLRRPNEPGGGLIFPGRDPRKPMSDLCISWPMNAIHPERGLTVHGFRSTFRTWAGTRKEYSRDICEAALSHYPGGTEGAYLRGGYFDTRRELMRDWSDFLARAAENVVTVQAAAAA